LKKPNSNIPPLETKVLPSGSDCDCVMVSVAKENLEKNKSSLVITSMKGRIAIILELERDMDFMYFKNTIILML
jgi:uncharacterized membrane protein YdfJ with MMPL/SSD domain